MSDDDDLHPRVSAADRVFRGLAIASSLLFTALAYDLITHPLAGAVSSGAPHFFRIMAGIIGLGTVLVSGLILWRVPGNPVGRFLLLFAIGFTGWQFSYNFGSEPINNTLFLIFYFYWGAIGLPALPYLIIWFPNGRVYPAGLRKWVLVYALLKTLGSAMDVMTIGPGTLFAEISYNPFLVDSLVRFRGPISVIMGAQGVSIQLALLMAIASITLRYRRASAHERQQIKWLLWCSFILAVVIAIWFTAHKGNFSYLNESSVVDLPTYFVLMLYPAVAIGVGILRHHLWDIDIIIRRTAIYGIITLLLGLTYFAGAAILQSIFVRLSGSELPLATVVTTLGIATLFTPLRRRVQDFVDRRFYRRKYDAQQTLDHFSEAVRDEVDIEALKADLMGAVNTTLHPATITLWMRED